jgi:hypothetical protein
MKKVSRLILLCFLVMGTAYGSMAQKSTKSKQIPSYKHLIAFHPLHVNADHFVGIGFSYERSINNNFGIKIPMMISLNQPYVNLGVSAKFYPRKKFNDPVSYAIAPTLYAGKGQDRNMIFIGFDPITGQSQMAYDNTPRTQIGFLLNHSLNVNVVQQVYLGLDGGIGINYYDNKAYRDNTNTNLSFAAQFHIAVGYRF